ncbi:DNA mismatch repair endonuclease MutL [Fusicatenibacter sp.]|uniref:DNA mismatch repair endonuclease MutL n=1 Tax=Fusicatenibacter sp. TaxID=2773922 RepID=UPI00399AA424
MKTISVLDKNTIDKIAAGEVIERPSSIVKELVENAIDAGSNAVTVEIKDGGTTLVRITDNGEGIAPSEVKKAFMRHATSKITKAEDLFGITSLGFRGEALSSIAAVCQVELITKMAGELTGVRYAIEGGEEKTPEPEEIGAPEGTTFKVRNVFYNTPVRRKFLKSPQTEAGYINDLMERLALSHPEVSFKFINNNQNRLHTSGNSNLKDIIYGIYGREITANLVEVHGEAPFGTLTGYIGKPIISRGNRNYENYFINGRYIRSSIISKAIEDAYKNFMMQHKYPFTVLHFQLDGDLLDVNVHPTKMELRFSDQEGMYRLVYETVRNALVGREMIPDVHVGKEAPAPKEPPKKESFPEPFEVKRREAMMQEKRAEAKKTAATIYATPGTNATRTEAAASIVRERPNYSSSREEGGFAKSLYEVPENLLKPTERKVDEQAEMEKWTLEGKNPVLKLQARPATNDTTAASSAAMETPTSAKPAEAELPPESPIPPAVLSESEPATSVQSPKQMDLFEEKLLSKEHIKEHRIIGQLFETYWLVEFHEKLYIIDQHAAHEKVLFERTMKSLKDKEYTAQQISPPLIVSLSIKEQELLNKYMKNFETIGFEIEPFGGDEFSIRAVPGNLFGLAERDVFLEMLDSLDKDTGRVSEDLINEKIASMSCKAAVKGNHRLSEKEAEALIDELLTLDNPYNCPHGRPTIIAMSKYELEKKFKRIV